MKDTEKTFEYLRDSVRLSESERASGRAQLLAFMQERPTTAPTPSPFRSFLTSPFLRYGMGALFLVVMGSGGVAYAAMDAGPADALYVVKVRVTEPVQVALTLDPKERADFQVDLVNERLKEVAEATVTEELTSDQMALVVSSLSDNIDEAQESITALHEDNQSGDALDTASDLATSLSTHTEILEKVQQANPEAADSLTSVVSEVSSEIGETAGLIDTTQDAVEDEATTTETNDEQAADTATLLAQIQQEVAGTLSTLDGSDRDDINESLAEIKVLIADAEAKDAAGNYLDAYLLYVEAGQRLNSLHLTIEADQTLQIDVIDEGTTDTAAE